MKIMCPTYKRKSPRILELMKKFPNDDIYFCVRKEEFEKGFYDEWKTNEHCKFILLEGCSNIGNTRKKILEYCFEHNEKYITMLDDNVFDVICEGENSLNQIFEKVIDDERSDPYFDRVAAIRIPKKKARINKSGTKNYSASVNLIFILDIEKIKLAGINFEDSLNCGHEDFVFAYELHMNGLCSVNSKIAKVRSRSCLPHLVTSGGTHENQTTNDAIKMMNDKCELSIEYLKNKYADRYKQIGKMTSKHKGYEIFVLFQSFGIKEILKNEQGNRKEN